MKNRKKQIKTKILVVSGSVASGKSTVATKLSELFKNAPVIKFDDYEKYIVWPEDMAQWMMDGFDPNAIRVPRLKDDLLSLLTGETIIYPADEKVIKAEKYIILEEPSGREREEISELIDQVIFIDVPQDICVIRMIQRVIDMEIWKLEGTFRNEAKEDIAQQLDLVATWVDQYQRARLMYMTVSETVKNSADIVVNGLMSIDEITNEIGAKI